MKFSKLQMRGKTNKTRKMKYEYQKPMPKARKILVEDEWNVWPDGSHVVPYMGGGFNDEQIHDMLHGEGDPEYYERERQREEEARYERMSKPPVYRRCGDSVQAPRRIRKLEVRV